MNLVFANLVRWRIFADDLLMSSFRLPSKRVARAVPASARSAIVQLTTAAAMAGLLGTASIATAQVYAPVIELFRLGPPDRLVIDRSGPVDTAGDVNGDGLPDLILAVGIGSVRVVFGPTRGNNGLLNVTQLNGRIGFSINGDGPHVAGLGDINGDGLDDVAVGSADATYVVFGRRDGFPSLVDVNTLDGRNGFTVTTPTSAIGRAGDINGDGFDDFVVGNAEHDPDGDTDAGSTYVIYGRAAGHPARLNPALLNGRDGFAVRGVSAGDLSGYAAEYIGDFNADGLDDFMIGAPGASRDGVDERGEAYAIFGSREAFPARITLADIDGRNGFMFRGSNFEDRAGTAVSYVGDLNRDGISDLAIGAPGKGPFGEPSDYPGETYVFFGGYSTEEVQYSENDLQGDIGFVIRGIRGGVIPVQEDQPRWGDMSGQALDFAGDINNDGIDDMIIGASQTIINPRRTGNGQTYVVFGRTERFPSRLSLADLDGFTGFRYNGIGTTDYSGFSISRAGDFSGDGLDDFIIGAAGEGVSYVMYGRQGAFAPPPARIRAPGNLRAEISSAASLELRWNRSTAPIGHEVYRDGEFVTSISGAGSSYFIPGLTPGQTYTFRVHAVGVNGLYSEGTNLVVEMPFEGQPVPTVAPAVFPPAPGSEIIPVTPTPTPTPTPPNGPTTPVIPTTPTPPVDDNDGFTPPSTQGPDVNSNPVSAGGGGAPSLWLLVWLAVCVAWSVVVYRCSGHGLMSGRDEASADDK